MKILVLNLGSTSTKAGLFEGSRHTCSHTIRHSKEELAPFDSVMDQKEFRKEQILKWLKGQGLSMADIDLIATRGGLIRPIRGGVYFADEAAAHDAASGDYGFHPANVGLLIAREWSLEYSLPAVFVDAPATEELSDIAKVSGYAPITRRSIFHALNAKRAARRWCAENGQDIKNSSLIVAHMGGGVTVCALDGLAAIDVNNGVDGEGPFSPERAGSLPLRQMMSLAETYEKGPKALFDDSYRKGGLYSYFGTNDVGALVKRAEDEPRVKLVLDAFCYNIAKQIAAMAVALMGRVDQIVLTGGVAYNQGLMEEIERQVCWIAPVSVYPGEDELAALAEGAHRYMQGLEEAKSIDS